MLALGYSAENILYIELVICVILAERQRKTLPERSLRYQLYVWHKSFVSAQ